MEDSCNINSSNDDNRISKISRKREHSQLFWYDIRNLPDSMIIEILARLPVESIFRFKCVFKHWQTLISQPSFSRFYFSILNSNAASSSSSLPFRILHRLVSVRKMKYLRLEFYNPSGFCLLSRPAEGAPIEEEEARISQHFQVLAMSNGLILCCFLSSTPCVYYVCDPLTQQWITLPASKSRFRCYYGEGLITRVNQDHTLTGYTVVRLSISPKISFNNFVIEMFSSESSEWVSYELDWVIPTPLPMHHHRNPIHIYGAFNWLVVKHGMIAFDPYKDPKSVRLIPFPNDRDLESEWSQDGSFQICDECQGTLRYFEVSYDPTKLNFLTMWSMKDYEKGEWCCEFKVTRMDIHCNDPELSNWLLNGGTFLPLWFHPMNNVNVVYLRCKELGWIVSYDVLNRRLDVAYKGISKFVDLSWRMVIPFVLPKWPMLMPNHPFRV